MNSPERVEIEDLRSHLLARRPILDVRAPIEFARGHLPGSTNLPILDDLERDLVGKEYRKAGADAAFRLGQKLVSGERREGRIRQWCDWLDAHPDAFMTCFRGGLRSRIAQEWIFAHSSLRPPRLAGGYKRGRAFLARVLEETAREKDFLILAGRTGSGKSRMLREFSGSRALDLELLAVHRGSAFGGFDRPQPSQAQFELEIGSQMLGLANAPQILVEDESRMVGVNVVPEVLFSKMRQSSVVELQIDLEERVEEIWREYVLNGLTNPELFEGFIQSLRRISKKLGGLRTQELVRDVEACRARHREDPRDVEGNREWIRKLLEWYYDPLYDKSFKKRNPQILLRGSRAEVRAFLQAR